VKSFEATLLNFNIAMGGIATIGLETGCRVGKNLRPNFISIERLNVIEVGEIDSPL
jgi:hypothetical protein